MKHHQTGLKIGSECLFAWKGEELDRVEDPLVQPSPALAKGTAFHEFDRAYAEHCRETGQQTDLAEAEKLLAPFADQLTPEDFEDLSEIVDAYLRQGAGLVPADAHVETFVAIAADGTPTTRGSFDCWLYGTVDRWWLTREDNVTVLHVRDRKTNRRVWSPSEAKRQLQLPLYAAMLLAHLQLDGGTVGHPRIEGRIDVKAGYDFVRYGASRDFELGEEDLADALDRARRIAATIEKAVERDEFPARPGCGHCVWCRVKALCPGREQLRRASSIAAGVDPAEVARQVHWHEEIAKAMKAELKAHVEAHGPVYDGNATWDFRPQETRDFDARRVAEFLELKGLKPVEVLSILGATKTRLTAGLKRLKHTELVDPVLALADTSAKTVFKRQGND